MLGGQFSVGSRLGFSEPARTFRYEVGRKATLDYQPVQIRISILLLHMPKGQLAKTAT